jgi:hypothetical protein
MARGGDRVGLAAQLNLAARPALCYARAQYGE